MGFIFPLLTYWVCTYAARKPALRDGGGSGGTGPPPSAVNVFRNAGGGSGGTGPPPSTRCVCAGLPRSFGLCCKPCVEGKDKAAININELRIKPQDLRALIIVSPTFRFGLPSPVGAMEPQNGSLWGRK